MRVREAKDSLVQQVVEQASLERVPFSDVEKRMLYFTENTEISEDLFALNAAFEAEYNTSEYEAKVAKLMLHAYARLKMENPSAARTWDEAIKQLKRGDLYILLPWNLRTVVERPPWDVLKLFGTALLVIAVMFGCFAVARHFGIHWNSGPTVHRSIPVWVQRLLLAAVLGVYVYSVIVPLMGKKPTSGIGQLVVRLLRSRFKDAGK